MVMVLNLHTVQLVGLKYVNISDANYKRPLMEAQFDGKYKSNHL